MLQVIILQTGVLRTNTYLFDCGGFLACVDAGGDADKIFAAAKKEKKPVGALLLTHAHFDHCGAAAKLQRAGARVYLCGGDQAVLNQSFARGVEKFKADELLTDGQTLRLGNKDIAVIGTAGHTKGSVCYRVEDCLFSGDTLFQGDVGRCDLFSGDFLDMKNSLKKLFLSGVDCRVLPGHGAETTLFEEKETNPYV